jgi:HEAT repeat protein
LEGLADPAQKYAQNDRRAAAVRALGVWGTKEQVPRLVEFVSHNSQDMRWGACEALARLKDPRGAAPVAHRLQDPWDRGKAVEALSSYGPAAEEAVIPYLKSTDVRKHWIKQDACKVLKVIGTAKSIPALEEAEKETDHFVQQAARSALESIRNRLGASAGKPPDSRGKGNP